MSSIRLFILSSFAELGPMHGHRLRQEAERKRVPFWTDIPVGAVYGAMNRLAAEGLLREAGREQEGNRPTRQLYEITEDGRHALARLRHDGLTEIWFKYDPFDLALTRVDTAKLDELPALLADRLARMKAQLEERRRMIEQALPFIGVAEEWAVRHTAHRMEAEVQYLTDLITALPNLIADERNPRPRKEKP
ncbi:DNA-binding PadR family transcriptional regulator [Rhizobium sp. BK226]|uniref:PadR family transcriptional regulator n=1 Tax=Rhizobium sp. BK226 TaxID=2587075 RepID=UPI001619C0FA|nr:PadR family transcriptional regulator [Rhizobium sp. BK226]MBB4113235.1 DNA-binding PadR family transcriptional regulator [Rhizobium sp. BK226]